jgi:hypothetical protein
MNCHKAKQFFRATTGLLALAAAATHSGSCPGAPPIVLWEIEATVISVEDPEHIFPNVRPGDPVRGTLKYDWSLKPDPFSYEADAYASFPNDTWFGTVAMIIANPRDGSAIEFMRDPEGCCADVDVANNYDFGEDDTSDFLFAYQGVVAPAGFGGSTPIIDVELYGPNTVLSAVNLPDTLSLDDWPEATISFEDLYDFSGKYCDIEAEIYSLTPRPLPRLAGDFAFDGDVDGDDLWGWQPYFGSTSGQYADANDDGDADGDDFLIWQRNLGARAAAGALNAHVPEPAAVVLTLGVTAGVTLFGRSNRRG